MHSKNALGSLIKRYKVVLSKCNILNTFGTLALASGLLLSPMLLSDANAVSTNPSGTNVYSMDATTLGDAILENYGTISDGQQYSHPHSLWAGMFGHSFNDVSYNFTNFGTITIHKPTNNAIYGMHAYSSNGDHTLTNSGTIIVSGATNVYGMDTHNYNSGSHTLTNSGTIIASGATNVYGMLALTTNGDHTLTNSGTMTISGTGDGVYGMRADGAGNHKITNSGTMTVSGANDNVYGMYALTTNGNYSLTNIGTIDVSGTDAVYGMYVTASNVNNGIHLLNNTGIITAKATAGKAFEAYGDNNYNVNTWATTLRTWSATDAVFGGNGVTVNFANSKLILRADSRTVMGQDYRIHGTAEAMAQGVTVGGTITTAVSESPTLKATLVDGNTPATATVRLEPNVNSNTTPNPTASQQAVVVTHGQMANIARELRQITFNNISPTLLVNDADTSGPSGTSAPTGMAAGSSMDENKWLVFINPYANAVSNSEYNFNGSHLGITVGGSYKVSDKFSFGAHLDFNSANYAADVYDLQSKSTSFALGLHGTYNFTPEFYLQGQITGAISQTDSYYELGGVTPADADSNYNGETLHMGLNAGYVWKIAGDSSVAHSLTPVLGLSYLSTRTAAYDVDWGNAALAIYDMKYDDTYYSALYGNVNLDWRSEWALQNDSSIALIAGVGLRQNLSGNEVVSNLRTLGGSYTTRTSEDMTTWLADVGVEYRKGNFSVSLNYDGGFGYAQTSHGGNIMIKLGF